MLAGRCLKPSARIQAAAHLLDLGGGKLTSSPPGRASCFSTRRQPANGTIVGADLDPARLSGDEVCRRRDGPFTGHCYLNNTS